LEQVCYNVSMNASVAPIHLKLFLFLIVFKGGSYFIPQHCETFFNPLYYKAKICILTLLVPTFRDNKCTLTLLVPTFRDYKPGFLYNRQGYVQTQPWL